MQSHAIFPLFYLPPVSYFSALQANDFDFVLEAHEHFPKQTYRNRTTISSPNGSLDLYIPVIKGSKVHTVIKNVKISYDFKWQRLHWLSIQNSYRNSAYFEYYEDELASFYHKKYDYLFDYNLELLTWVFSKLKKTVPMAFTEEYIKTPEIQLDFRDKLNFKNPEVTFPAKPYFANLSIVDLLFSQGPQAKLYL
jgi:hypothetical protein